MPVKRILVVCSTGAVTSTVLAEQIKEVLKQKGILADVIQCKVSELPMKADTADFIVAATRLNQTFPVPMVNAIGVFMGPPLEKVLNQIIKLLREK